jgi:hypothetical protein
MQGKEFLDVARYLLRGATPAHRRAAAGRAYCALLLEGREALQRWGITPPPRDKVHMFVRLRFTYARDQDARNTGLALDQLSQLRNRADYDLGALEFDDDVEPQHALTALPAELVFWML